MKGLAALLAVTASLGLVAAGCGGGGGGGERLSKEEYQSRMQELGKDLSGAAEGLGSLSPTDIQGATKAIEDLADLMEEASDRLDEINPPENIAGAHEKLIEGARQAADEFRDLAEEIRSATLEDAAALAEKLGNLNVTELEGFKKLQEGVEEIRSKGYELGQTG